MIPQNILEILYIFIASIILLLLIIFINLIYIYIKKICYRTHNQNYIQEHLLQQI